MLKEQLECLKEEAIQSRGGLIKAIGERHEAEEELGRLRREMAEYKADTEKRVEASQVEIEGLRKELEELRNLLLASKDGLAQ